MTRLQWSGVLPDIRILSRVQRFDPVIQAQASTPTATDRIRTPVFVGFPADCLHPNPTPDPNPNCPETLGRNHAVGRDVTAQQIPSQAEE